MAMGAEAGDVLRMILRLGISPVAIGMLLAVGLAALLGNALRLLFFNISPYDPATFAGIALVLTFTGIVACLVPPRRAARVDPMVALRDQ